MNTLLIETERIRVRDFVMEDADESCKAVLAYAFRERHAHKVFAETIDPVKSTGLMKKLGMELEGIQREQTKDASGNWADMFLYGILSAQWHSRQSARPVITVPFPGKDEGGQT